MMETTIIVIAAILIALLLYFVFSSKRNEAEKAPMAHERTKEDDFITKSFLRAESAYRHQTCMMHRYDYGEKVRIGDIVDFLVGKGTAEHVTGLSICVTGDDDVEPERHEFVGNAKTACEEDLLSLVAYKDASGNVKALRRRNVTLTLLIDNRCPIVLFVRNMIETPYLHYVRIYSMTGNDIISKEYDRPVFNSTLICCKVTDQQTDINKHLDFYQQVEDDVKDLTRHGLPLKNSFQYKVLEGLSGRKSTAAYIRIGNYYFDEHRFVDASRQYARAFNGLKNSAGNTLSDKDYGALYYMMAISIMNTGSTLRAFYYIDKAYRYDASLELQRLAILAGLADYRTIPMLEKMEGRITDDDRQAILFTYRGCCEARKKRLREEKNYMRMGTVLELLSLATQQNVSGMTISRHIEKVYLQETIQDPELVWNYPLRDKLLEDNNTIIISYSLTGEGNRLRGDHSKLCPDNSIIMQVNPTDDSSVARVDVMMPAFVYDPDKMTASKDYLPEHKSFLIAKSPIEFGFQYRPLREIIGEASELWTQGRFIEALFGATYAFAQLSAHCDESNEIERAKKIIGCCFRDLGYDDKAEYYLRPNLKL